MMKKTIFCFLLMSKKKTSGKITTFFYFHLKSVIFYSIFA